MKKKKTQYPRGNEKKEVISNKRNQVDPHSQNRGDMKKHPPQKKREDIGRSSKHGGPQERKVGEPT